MARVFLKQLSKAFSLNQSQGVHALRQLDLEIIPGERLALLGPSGSGKTTLLRLVAGLEQPTEGKILFDEASVRQLPPHARNLAFVPQEATLFPHLNVFENIAFGLRMRHVHGAEVEERVREIAQPLGLTPLLQRKSHELSGGERQRTCLARAFVKRPALILLDEPLAALDAPMRLELRSLLISLQQRWGITTLWVTHDQQEALAAGHRVAVLDAGRLQQVASAAELYHHPANLFVAKFVGTPAMNILAGSLSDTPRRFVSGASNLGTNAWSALVPADCLPRAVPDHASVLLGLRPEDVQLIAWDAAKAPEPGTVEHSEFLGPETLVRVRSGGQTWTVRVPGSAIYAPGTPVTIRPDFSKAHWFDPKTSARIPNG